MKRQVMLICVFFFFQKTFAQDFLQDKHFLLKTNILQTKLVQQWNVISEFKTKYPQQSNAFFIGYNNFLDKSINAVLSHRQGIYLGYSRVYYSLPINNTFYLSVAPYSKLLYRDVYRKGSELSYLYKISSLDFETISGVVGMNTEMHLLLKERISISTTTGLGGGIVLFSLNRWGGNSLIHADGQLGLKVGYVF